MKWIDSNHLPLDSTTVSLELTREIEDEGTGEVVAEHTIDVVGRFIPADNSVGLGAFIEVISAHRQDKDCRVEVELEDWEVDSLVGLLQEKMRTESDRDI